MNLLTPHAGLCIGVWLDDLRLPVRDALKRAPVFGCEALGINGLGAEVNPRNLGVTGRRELAHLYHASGARALTLKADVGGRRLADAKSLDASLTRIRETFDLARDLGARQVVVALGFVPPPPPVEQEIPAEAARAAMDAGGPANVTRIWGSAAAVRSTGFFSAPATGTPPKGSSAVPASLGGRGSKQNNEEDRRARAALAEGARALMAFSAQTGVRPAVVAGTEPSADLGALLNETDPGGMIEVDFQPGAFVARGFGALETLTELAHRVGLATLADHYRGGAETAFGHGDVPFGELIVVCSALPRAESIALLAASSRECDRLKTLSDTVHALKKLRQRPVS
ncbi:MAG: hypothetical protein HY291_17905 [Planctomycetes bacterium]|nr:hypothetical protein [Planctomycetota bacterium]